MGSTNGHTGRDAPQFPELGYTPITKVSEPWTVDKVLQAIPNAPPEAPSSPLAFFHILERLKTTKREGWRRFGISRGESIADHMYRMSLISMFAPPELAPRLDLPKCMKMCLIHDMAELLVGDITPVDGVAKPEKSRREASTMEFLTGSLLRNVPGGPATGEQIMSIWQEYEDSETLDSHYVHDIDKLELLLQMVEYEKAAKGKLSLDEFAYVHKKMQLPEMRTWGENVIKERQEYWASVAGMNNVEENIAEESKKLQDGYYDRA